MFIHLSIFFFKIMPNVKKASIEKMVIKTIPNLMSATVVEFSKGTQHTSDNHLNGYFALHRLFLWAIETYPGLQDEIDNRLKVRHFQPGQNC